MACGRKKKDRIGTRSVNWEDIDVSQAEQTSTPTIEAAQNPVDGHLNIVPFQAKLGTFFFERKSTTCRLVLPGSPAFIYEGTTNNPITDGRFQIWPQISRCVLDNLACHIRTWQHGHRPPFLPPSLTYHSRPKRESSILFCSSYGDGRPDD